MEQDLKRLIGLLDQLKKAEAPGIKAEALSPETKKLMELAETAIKAQGFKYIADNGFGPGTRPPKIPGYDRIPDFAVDRNADGLWDMIIEIKSSNDWNCSDEQLNDLHKFCRDRNMDFLIVVTKDIHPKADERYRSMGFFEYAKFNLVPIG